MSTTDYSCKHCRQTRAIDTSRIVRAAYLRCDACFALSTLTLGERLAMVDAATRDRPRERTAFPKAQAVSA